MTIGTMGTETGANGAIGTIVPGRDVPHSEACDAIGANGAIGAEFQVYVPLAFAHQRGLAPWSTKDWMAFFCETAAILEYDQGVERPRAARIAYVACVRQWLRRHKPLPIAVAAWRGTPEELRLARILDAETALARMGIRA